MNEKEYAKWMEETEKSKEEWKIDPIHKSSKDFLAYKGGEDGNFIMILDESLFLGTYRGAIPHNIGEAVFYSDIKLHLQTNEEAWEAVNEILYKNKFPINILLGVPA